MLFMGGRLRAGDAARFASGGRFVPCGTTQGALVGVVIRHGRGLLALNTKAW